MSFYENWLDSEQEWIGDYCRRTKRMSLLQVVPLVLIVLTVLFGAMGYLDGTVQDALASGASGLMIGVFVCLCYVLILFPLLSPKRYRRMVNRSVRDLKLTETEREQLAQEMLHADPSHVIEYRIDAPNKKNTPARFVKTPHYAYLAGTAPYAILIRMSDIAEIVPEEHETTQVTRGAKLKTYYKFTMFCIEFFRKDRAGGVMEALDMADETMEFYDCDLRDTVMELLLEDEG